MNALDILIPMLQAFEGCRLESYRDIVGVWTIGYGETLGVKEGDTWTQERADAELRNRAAQFLVAVLQRCPQLVKESANKQAACTCLAYNIGVGAFGASSVCRKTNRQEYAEAANSFLLWNKAGGKVVAGLTRRRMKEREVYLKE
jgi:lysozyme